MCPSCPSTASTTPSTSACASATHAEVKTIWLTASGGPFRQLPLDQFAAITPAQALKHPTWVMGRRITIDSATMLNKGLEIIEACRLFDVPPSQVRVTVHPQSTVHSLVEYVDGSILAQISVTDMRLPILYALAWPERPASTLTFDLASLRHLDFEPPDFERFPCLRLAFEAAEKGGAHCIALNAADEVAVEAFLEGRIPFMGIPRTIEKVLASTPEAHPATIAEVLASRSGCASNGSCAVRMSLESKASPFSGILVSGLGSHAAARTLFLEEVTATYA